MRKIDFLVPDFCERKKDLSGRREKKGMGNCFSSCFPKKTFVFEASEEDPETVALREESEKREDVGEREDFREDVGRLRNVSVSGRVE